MRRLQQFMWPVKKHLGKAQVHTLGSAQLSGVSAAQPSPAARGSRGAVTAPLPPPARDPEQHKVYEREVLTWC